MRLFKRMGRSAEKPDARVQLRTAETHPFGIMAGYVPLKSGEVRLYRTIREAVPLIDAAIVKLIRLTGGFTVHCADAAAQRQLNAFLKTVDAGRGQRGVHAFLDSYLDSLITCGRAVGEMVVTPGGVFRALLCGDVADIEIREGESPLEFEICAPADGGMVRPLPYQNLLLFTPFNPEADSPYGVSLLRSMPFLADILLKIYNTLGVNWDRAGNVRFAVVYKPQGDALDRRVRQALCSLPQERRVACVRGRWALLLAAVLALASAIALAAGLLLSDRMDARTAAWQALSAHSAPVSDPPRCSASSRPVRSG